MKIFIFSMLAVVLATLFNSWFSIFSGYSTWKTDWNAPAPVPDQFILINNEWLDGKCWWDDGKIKQWLLLMIGQNFQNSSIGHSKWNPQKHFLTLFPLDFPPDGIWLGFFLVLKIWNLTAGNCFQCLVPITTTGWH